VVIFKIFFWKLTKPLSILSKSLNIRFFFIFWLHRYLNWISLVFFSLNFKSLSDWLTFYWTWWRCLRVYRWFNRWFNRCFNITWWFIFRKFIIWRRIISLPKIWRSILTWLIRGRRIRGRNKTPWLTTCFATTTIMRTLWISWFVNSIPGITTLWKVSIVWLIWRIVSTASTALFTVFSAPRIYRTLTTHNMVCQLSLSWSIIIIYLNAGWFKNVSYEK